MFNQQEFPVYLVGGAVRDQLLGLNPTDRDYVVEATEVQFEAAFPELARVGNSFPVYLYEGNEVALTRTETSTGVGYQDFAIQVGVPIADDLGRRDFTINSIAANVHTGEIIDPFNGQQDLKDLVLRCINTRAFEDDPLRAIRAARFCARFNLMPDFNTLELLRQSAVLLETVTPERVELELQKMYKQCPKPSRFFYLLKSFGSLPILFPELRALRFVTAGPHQHHGGKTAFEHTMDAIDRAKKNGCSFSIFIAALCHDFGKATTPVETLPHHYGHENRSYEITKTFMERSRFDAHTQALALCVARNHMRTHILERMRPFKQVAFFRSIRKELREDFFEACNCDHPMGSSLVTRVFLLEDVIKTAKIGEIPKQFCEKDKVVGYVNGVYTACLLDRLREAT